MTVALQNTTVTYDTDGVTTAFPTTYRFLNSSDLVVETSDDGGESWSPLELGEDYSVDGAGADEPGGSVVFAVPPLTDLLLRIRRDTLMIQPVLLQQSGPYPPKSIMQQMDRLTLIVQELRAQIATLIEGGSGVSVFGTFTTADNGAQYVDFDLGVVPTDLWVTALTPAAGVIDSVYSSSWVPLDEGARVLFEGLVPDTDYSLRIRYQ